MSMKALVATLVLGSSSVALAQPVAREHREHRDYDRWGFHWRYQAPRRYHPVYSYPWYQAPVYQAPVTVTTPPVYQPPVYQPPVYQPPVYQPPVVQQPRTLQLMAASELANRFDINVGPAQLGNASLVRLDASGCEGAVYVDKVTIYYGDRSDYEQITVDRYLDERSPTFDIGLRTSGFGARIIVDGHSENGGRLAIEAL